MFKVKPYIVALVTCLVTPSLAAAEAPAENVTIVRPNYDTTFNQQVAVYEYLRGHRRDALLELAIDNSVLAQSANENHRELVRMEQLQTALHSHLAGDMPVDLNNQLWLDVSELRRQNGDCEGALDALEELKELTMDMDHRERLQRVTCMLDQHSLSNGLLVAAENIALAAEGNSLWLAYIYNNIAVGAQYLEDYAAAQGYFTKALEYTDQSDEGRSLASHIRLSLAYSFYSAFRYDYAVNTFAELKVSTEWIDLALLGYGWAAYKNNNPGLALESWRQLVRLPFKSISVYEGFIAIPFALEKQNAFSEAYAAYVSAIEEYDEVIGQVDRINADLDGEMLLEHALEYARSKDSEEVDPLDPLLVYAFARASFQDAFDTIAKIDETRHHVEQMEYTLLVLEEARRVEQEQRGNIEAALTSHEKRVKARLEQARDGLVSISDAVLVEAISRLPSDNPLASDFASYQKLKSSLSNTQKARMKGVLVGELQEEGQLIAEDQLSLIQLSEAYHRMSTRYQKYLKLKGNIQHSIEVDSQIAQMRTQLEATKAQLSLTETHAVDLLMAKTKESLRQQREQLSVFQNQARIAAARLGEEFYQRGGRRLWD
ncbi:Uncharacterised protein [BD1-7 clade bacterium]|uniref:Chromosome partition protein Smc n=1 Tax=BD1-7 clade bacterium TaxID=2029982 RepID=A0A5S9QUB1_9GAMM|nr:Uncharacterised protein [BD1-7 clade bacterium]